MEKVIGIYLSAGQSRRFGKNKLHQPIGKYRLGNIALCSAIQSELDSVIVVTNKEQPSFIQPALSSRYNEKIHIVSCDESYKGQSYSLKCGVNYARKRDASAVVILLADQPLISADMINKLISCYMDRKAEPVAFVAASHLGISRPPILFSRPFFKELLRLEGDQGARQLIKNPLTAGHFIDFPDVWSFFDVDTPEDYLKLIKKLM